MTPKHAQTREESRFDACSLLIAALNHLRSLKKCEDADARFAFKQLNTTNPQLLKWVLDRIEEVVE